MLRIRTIPGKPGRSTAKQPSKRCIGQLSAKLYVKLMYKKKSPAAGQQKPLVALPTKQPG